MRKKTLAERSKYKQIIHKTLFNNEELRSLLIGGLEGKSMAVQLTKFKEVCKSHMFIDDTELAAGTYVFYDVQFPALKPQIKTCEIVLYVICNRKIIADSGTEGYSGDRIDRMGELIEDCLINSEEVRKFGIGELSIDSVQVYNGAKFYGLCFDMTVPNFR